MKKRILTMLLALVMIVSMLPLAVFAATENDACISSQGHKWNASTGECDRTSGYGTSKKECDAKCTHSKGFKASGNSWYQQNICTTCGFNCDHKSNNKSQFDSTGKCSGCNYQCPHESVNQYTKKCNLCQVIVQTCEHAYNEANPGVCTDCDEPHNDHQYSQTAPGKCSICYKPCTHRKSNNQSNFGNDNVCDTCYYQCQHENYGGDNKCDTCGLTCQHTNGYNAEYKCNTCGTACTHKNGNQYTFTDGVCTKCAYVCIHDDGAEDDTCKKCNQLKHTHQFSPENGKCQINGCDVTCTHKFLTTGKCEICEMPCAHNWKYVRPQQDNEPTCTKGGANVVECDNCHMVTAQSVDPLGHAEEVLAVIVPATCTEKGISAYKCGRDGCGVMKINYVDPLGHSEEDVAPVPATCTSTGLTLGKKCTVCKKTLDAQVVIDKLPHSWKTVEAKEPTCNEDGYNAHQMCEKCQETEGKVVIPSHGTEHDYVNFKCKHCEAYDPNHEHEGVITSTSPASCTAAGSNTFKCKSCGYEWTETIKKLKHNYVNEKCTVCELINPNHEHRYTQIGYTAPTCTEDGKLNQRCDICDRHEESKINKLDHTYAGGLCTRCGAAAECSHSSKTTTIETHETCANTGLKKHTCNNCGKVTTETIPATGNHHYENYRCTGCDKAEPNKLTNDSQKIHVVG